MRFQTWPSRYLIAILVALFLLVHGEHAGPQLDRAGPYKSGGPKVRDLAYSMSARFETGLQQCDLVRLASDQCSFVQSHCIADQAGLLPYLQSYYCVPSGVRPLVVIALAIWLAVLFTTVGTAASDYFTPNLRFIATALGLSESLAGVTLLAFGNGSPDVFSTFIGLRTQSGEMAVGELIGAAGFISSVVAGSMAIMRPFSVPRYSFMRDVGFLLLTASFSLLFLSDGLYVYPPVGLLGKVQLSSCGQCSLLMNCPLGSPSLQTLEACANS